MREKIRFCHFVLSRPRNLEPKSCCRLYNTEPPSKKDKTSTKPLDKIPTSAKKSHTLRLNYFFKQNPQLDKVKKMLPAKYLQLKRITPPDNMYLIDPEVARQVARDHILPTLRRQSKDQVVAETNAGLGMISQYLLKKGVKVRLYESCPEFQQTLQDLGTTYKGKVELFTKDIFLLNRYAYIDTQDHGNRVEQLLRGVPYKGWTDDPAMTIIGTMCNNNFIRHTIRSLVLQSHLVTFGRIQLFVFMKPKSFTVLTAGPHLNLHTYQPWSVLFNLLFDYELLDKFSRKIFLPWESKVTHKIRRFLNEVDPESMYFVRISLKKELPVAVENLLAFHAFVTQFFGRGTSKVIPTLEKWVPGCGLEVLKPKQEHMDYFPRMDIFTQFGELTPKQILHVFEEVTTNAGFKDSPLMNLFESQLIKSETVETSIDEHLEDHISEEIQVKLD